MQLKKKSSPVFILLFTKATKWNKEVGIFFFFLILFQEISLNFSFPCWSPEGEGEAEPGRVVGGWQ